MLRLPSLGGQLGRDELNWSEEGGVDYLNPFVSFSYSLLFTILFQDPCFCSYKDRQDPKGFSLVWLRGR